MIKNYFLHIREYLPIYSLIYLFYVLYDLCTYDYSGNENLDNERLRLFIVPIIFIIHAIGNIFAVLIYGGFVFILICGLRNKIVAELSNILKERSNNPTDSNKQE